MKPHIFLTPNPHVNVELSPYGAALKSFRIDDEEIIFSDITPYDEPNTGYNGQFVAPFAGRIREGKIGKYAFPLNEGNKSLHSASFSSAWQLFESEIEEESTQIRVKFFRRCKVFEAACSEIAEYVFFKDRPGFRLTLSFHSDDVMPVNMANHLYFRLGEGDMKEVTLLVPADYRATYDEENIPLGFVPVEGRFDYRNGRKLTDPLDHAFLLKGEAIVARGNRFEMRVTSDAKAAVIYRLPKGFTLELVHHPLLGEECLLPAGKEERIVATYDFLRI